MFAVIKTGGKQYKVAKDDTFVVERLSAEAGETIQFNDVLMVGGETLTVGTPFIDGAGVQAEVVEQGRGPKLLNLKRRRRKHSSRRLKGHRQYLTTLRVTDILTSGADASGIKKAVGAAVGGAPALGSIVAPAAPATPAVAEAPEAVAEPVATEPAVEAETEEAEAAPVEAAPVEEAAAERPENLLTEPKGEPDDLTKISGVGAKLAEKMNDNGVFHFWQIAEWGPGEIAYMDDQLSFKGRIERDDWIGQAKTFAAGDES